MRKIWLSILGATLTHHAMQATVKSRYEDFLYETKLRMQYIQPYAIAGSLTALSMVTSKNVSNGLLATAGIYSLYAWYSGLAEIRTIRHKYKRATQPKDHWSSRPETEKPFLFGRWRQLDDQFGDGIYWPSAWWMGDNTQEVLKHLIKDIYSNRIILIEQGKKIELPSPAQILKAINKELRELEDDKEVLKKYTNVYRMLSCAEEFKPDTSYFKLFWPNYNNASRLYVDIIGMIQRLEILRDIISNMKSSSGGHGWPQVR